jgi:cytochrome c-type biogenesis protein CcmH/NrfF
LVLLGGGALPAVSAVRRFGSSVVPPSGRHQNQPSSQRAAEPQDSLVGELMDPTRAGKLRGRVTEYENHPVVVGVEEKIRCTCGCNLSVYTCRTTDFTCETSPAMHQRVVELMEQQQSAQQILDAFVAQYGESVLMAPPRRGFNLAGYLVPGILITLVGGALAVMIVRQTRVQAVRRSGGQVDAGRPTARASDRPDTDEQARIKAELEKLGM